MTWIRPAPAWHTSARRSCCGSNADDEEAQAALDRAGIRLEAADMAAGKITAH